MRSLDIFVTVLDRFPLVTGNKGLSGAPCADAGSRLAFVKDSQAFSDVILSNLEHKLKPSPPTSVQELFESVKARDPAQPEFLQAVEEVRQHFLVLMLLYTWTCILSCSDICVAPIGIRERL